MRCEIRYWTAKRTRQQRRESNGAVTKVRRCDVRWYSDNDAGSSLANGQKRRSLRPYIYTSAASPQTARPTPRKRGQQHVKQPRCVEIIQTGGHAAELSSGHSARFTTLTQAGIETTRHSLFNKSKTTFSGHDRLSTVIDSG